ncbi:MAG: winged helix-turn-helix transcriptional regulator [Nanoarchaeota archaeon]|nr:winged helix-turn-helix transcriptional regulator [Nanoarchaeota archaeon]
MKDYNLISFLQKGKRRLNVLKSLKDKPKTPKEIASELKLSTSNVSNALLELSKQNLVKCITPTAHFYRYYEITKKGKNIIKQLT